MNLNQGLISPPPSSHERSRSQLDRNAAMNNTQVNAERRRSTSDAIIGHRRSSTQTEPIASNQPSSPTPSQRTLTSDSINNNASLSNGRVHSRQASLVGSIGSADSKKATKTQSTPSRTTSSSAGSLSPNTTPQLSLQSSEGRTSPSTLRPIRHVEEVTTIKRQPKNGWL